MPRCPNPKCESTKVAHSRWVLRATKPRVMQWRCKDCGKYFQEKEG